MKRMPLVGYLMLLPFFLAFAVFTIYPVLNTFTTSFTNDSLTSLNPAHFIGVQNYQHELVSPLFWKTFFNTWAIWLPNIILQMALALFVAAVMTNYQIRLKGKSLFRAVIFFPNIVTVTTIAILVYALFDWQSGAINQLLFGSHHEKYINWFSHGYWAQMVIAGVQTWMWFGFTAIMLISGIQSMPKDYFEAAVLDGASDSKIFFSIVLPIIRPVMVYIMITSLIGGMNMFDLPWVLFSNTGGPDQGAMTMSVYMYSRAFTWDQNLGAGSAVAWIVFAIIGVFTLAYLRVTYGKENAEETMK